MGVQRSREPFLWALFSGGGMLSALCLPALAIVLWVAPSLGWIDRPSYAGLLELVRNPIVRLFLFGFIVLCFFHWAHRFRYTLYDGLQLYHLNMLIAVVTYGIATVLSFIAAYVTLILL